MKVKRWHDIDRVFQIALECDPAERTAFLNQLCADDPSLRNEVEALIRSYEQAGDFIEEPLFKAAPELVVDSEANSLAGRTVGPYRVETLLGAGGMGEVFLAEDIRLGRKVALKLLPPDLVAHGQARARFIREGRLASALDHPNICTIYEAGETAGRCFIAMQLIEGKTLKRVIDGRPLDLDSLLAISLQVADGLALAHRRGIIHRDIKSHNIIITPRGQAKILDFGLAKLLEKEPGATELELTESGMPMGSPAYMSPEQSRGERADHRSDIFSFGVVLYEMATGRTPFKEKSQAETIASIINKPHAPVREWNPDVPAGLQAIIDQALAKNPDERYQSAEQLISDLRQLAAEIDSFGHRSDIPDGSVIPYVQPKPRTTAERIARRVKRLVGNRALLFAIAMLIAAAGVLWLYLRNAHLRWASQQIPRIEQLAQARQYFEAYDLAVQVREYLPDEPTILRLIPKMSDSLSIVTEPAGARVYLKRFSLEPQPPPPVLVGTTPITNLPIARGDYLLSLEKEGYAKAEQTISGALRPTVNGELIPPPIRIEARLIEADIAPDRMAYVPGGDYRVVAWRRPTDARVRLDSYFIDKFEVTNQEFKQFVNAGGYQKQEFWKHPFIKDGRRLLWEEAMREMRDGTGLPGPRSWSNQTFPEGKADHPVTDVTWYEAAAYAEFRGKQLPTIFQWEKAARNGVAISYGVSMPWGLRGETTDYRANFKGTGTMPVSSYEFGMSPFGCYHMAGNVSEWCLNETSSGFITSGGSWEDPSYLFGFYGTYRGFYNSNKHGFRCVKNLPDAAGDGGAMKIDIAEEVPIYRPLSGERVKPWFQYYEYEKGPLDAQVIEAIETDEWRREKISYNGANGERVTAYLYLPKNAARPLQVIHLMPAGDVFSRMRSLPEAIEIQYSSFIRSGRAIFTVMLKGFIGRDRSEGYKPPDPNMVEFLEEEASRVLDLRRGLDYLETRDDIDTGKLAYFAPSSIGFKHILPAVEARYRSVIFFGSAVRKYQNQSIPAANAINFIPHIRAPKLDMHGLYDEAAPLKTEGEPFHRLLSEPKRLVIFEGGHIPSAQILIPTMNAWLDETLGPVRNN